MAPAAPLGLSESAAARIRRITVLTVALLAASAAVLSFSGLVRLAEQSGFPTTLAWLFPLMIDGMVLTGSLGVIASTLVGVNTWYMWMLTLTGVLLSVVGNVLAAPPDVVSQAVHAAPPIVFALSVEGLLRVYRAQASAGPPPRSHAGEGQTDEPSADELSTVAVNDLTVGLEPGPVVSQIPEPDTSTPEPAPEQPAAQPVVPPTRVVPSAHETARETVREGTTTGTARERVAALLREDPEITGGEAARRLDIDPSHARKILRSLRQTNSEPAAPIPSEDSPVNSAPGRLSDTEPTQQP